MANPDNPNGFKVSRVLGAGPVKRLKLPVGASQTIAKGDAVVWASGLVQIATATSGTILGIAEQAITTDGSPDRATDQISVIVATSDTVFSGQCSGNSTAALVGTDVDIEGTTGIMEINEDATLEQVARVIGLLSDTDPDLDIGANDRVEFLFIRSAYDGLKAAL